jgi:hypothetical protein
MATRFESKAKGQQQPSKVWIVLPFAVESPVIVSAVWRFGYQDLVFVIISLS